MVASKGKISPPALPVTGGKGQPATYQTRISDFADMDRASGDKLLSAYAELYCRVQRRLFADVAAGRTAVSLKQEYLRRYQIPARMFNGVRVSLEGKVASVREQQLLRRDALQGRIARAQEQIAQTGEGVRRDWLHQKRRRLGTLPGLSAPGLEESAVPYAPGGVSSPPARRKPSLLGTPAPR